MSRKFDELMNRTASVVPAPDVSLTPRSPKTAPGQLGQLSKQRDEALERLEEAEARVASLEEQLRTAQAQGGSVDIPTELLVEVPGRRRHLTAAQYSDLKNNLANNKMVQPIVVRPLPEGKFEIVSGNNRYHVHLDLGRPTARCVLDNEASSDQAETDAFFANFFQPDLTDYEKYVGFKRYEEKHPGVTHQQIAEKVGVPRSTISSLMAFANLPDEALQIIHASPDFAKFGARAMVDLAHLAKQGKQARVIEAIGKLAAGELDQDQAVVYAATMEKEKKPAAARPDPIKIRSGKSVYCEMVRASKVLRLSFKTEDEAAEVEQAVREVLQRRADIKKSES